MHFHTYCIIKRWVCVKTGAWETSWSARAATTSTIVGSAGIYNQFNEWDTFLSKDELTRTMTNPPDCVWTFLNRICTKIILSVPVTPWNITACVCVCGSFALCVHKSTQVCVLNKCLQYESGTMSSRRLSLVESIASLLGGKKNA